MKNVKIINLKEIKEALKQADANLGFEEVKLDYENNKTESKTKTLKRSNCYDKRPLG